MRLRVTGFRNFGVKVFGLKTRDSGLWVAGFRVMQVVVLTPHVWHAKPPRLVHESMVLKSRESPVHESCMRESIRAVRILRACESFLA